MAVRTDSNSPPVGSSCKQTMQQANPTSGVTSKPFNCSTSILGCRRQPWDKQPDRVTPLQPHPTRDAEVQRHLFGKDQQVGLGQDPPQLPGQGIQKNTIPNKLKITVKPLVIKKDSPTFTWKWNDVIRRAKMELTNSVWPPIGCDPADQCNYAGNNRKTFQTLRAADIAMEEVKKALEDTLKEVNSTCKTKNDARQKRKIEAAANNQKIRTKRTNNIVLTSTITIALFTVQYCTFHCTILH